VRASFAEWTPIAGPVGAVTVRIGFCSCGRSAFAYAAEVIVNGQIVAAGGLESEEDGISFARDVRSQLAPRSWLLVDGRARRLVVSCPPPARGAPPPTR
jgi:hypothetical protein